MCLETPQTKAKRTWFFKKIVSFDCNCSWSLLLSGYKSKASNYETLVTSPLGRTSDRGTHTHTVTRAYTSRKSPTHFLCATCKAAFSSFPSARGGSMGLMTFPMCHKHCMWEAADSSTARLHVPTFMHICMSLWRAHGGSVARCQVSYTFFWVANY